MKWRAIVSEEKSEIYQNKLDEIAKTLLKASDSWERNGLMQGKAGISLFFFYYAELSGKEIFYDKGLSLISDALEAMGQYHFHSFGKGEPGVGWALEHLVKNGFFQYETDEILDFLDEFIPEQIQAMLENGVFDLLNGAIGNGLYLLNRSEKKQCRQLLSELVKGLDTHSLQIDSKGITWESTIWDIKEKPKGINLGLLYGVSGIIVFLTKLLEQDIQKEKTALLLQEAVEFLLHQALPPESRFRFPGWASEQGITDSCGLSLGYGDLSVAMTLWQAASVTGNETWRQTALETLIQTTRITGFEENRVMDASLSVGTSGISHLYNRMYHYTEDEMFKNSALFWLEQTLNLGHDQSGFAGFKAWRSQKSTHKDKDFALLEGIAGIGLTLISAISHLEPKWDRCFLLS